MEDTLKQALRLSERGELTLHKLGQRLSLRPAVLRSHLQSLGQKKLLQRRGEQLVLSETGKEEASRLVRAHRLWETYLVEKMGLTEEQIHEEAEKYEHLLSDELLDEVDRTLGFPPLDPHGSPIPMKGGRPDHPLNLLQKNQQARIAQKQVNDRISTRLWELSLLPGTPFVMQKLANDSVELLLADRLIELPTELARQVNVETAN